MFAAVALAGCIPRTRTPVSDANLPPPVADPAATTTAPRLALDLSNLRDTPPVWEMKPVTAAALDVRAATYIVKSGDTLRGIGEATGAGSEAIARANALVAPYVLRTGQSLWIPGGRYHRVREGETGIAIARAYGLRWDNIVAANGLTEPFVLRLNQRLVLPGTASPASATPPAISSGDPLVARAAAFQIGIDDLVTGSEPARSNDSPAAPRVATLAAPPARFIWPINGSVTSRFGPQGSGRINQGIDIATTPGAGIKAASGGVIAFVGGGVPGYGGMILVRHDGNWISAYGRVETSLVNKGQSVSAGQTLGKASGEPLHFELRRARVAVDPSRYLPAR